MYIYQGCDDSLIDFSTTPRVSRPLLRSEPTLIASRLASGEENVVTAPGTITSEAIISPPRLIIGLKMDK